MADSRVKIPDRVVREIQESLSGMTQMEAATKFGVSLKTVFLISKRTGRYGRIADEVLEGRTLTDQGQGGGN